MVEFVVLSTVRRGSLRVMNRIFEKHPETPPSTPGRI